MKQDLIALAMNPDLFGSLETKTDKKFEELYSSAVKDKLKVCIDFISRFNEFRSGLSLNTSLEREIF